MRAKPKRAPDANLKQFFTYVTDVVRTRAELEGGINKNGRDNDSDSGNEMWYLAPGAASCHKDSDQAFVQTADDINIEGLDLLDYMIGSWELGCYRLR